MRVELTLDDIRELLIEVCARLEKAEIQATIRLVGGAATELDELVCHSIHPVRGKLAVHCPWRRLSH